MGVSIIQGTVIAFVRAGGCVGNRYAFLTLRERDIETGLDYFLARYYASTQGRFTSPDEFNGGPDELFNLAEDASSYPTFYGDLSAPQSLNKYKYCFHNPLAYIDPDKPSSTRAYTVRQTVSSWLI